MRLLLLTLCTVGIVGSSNSLFAQPGKKKPAAKPATTKSVDPFGGASTSDPFGGASGGAGNKKSATTNNNTSADPFGSNSKASNVNPFGGSSTANRDTTKKKKGKIDTIFAKSTVNDPLTTPPKQSLRNDNAIEKNLIKDRIPLAYEHIREDDAVYRQRIWRIIDAKEKINLAFSNPEDNDNGSQLFFAILIKAVLEGNVTAFDDERFTIPLTKEKFKEKVTGGLSYDEVQDLDGNVTGIKASPKEFPIEQFKKFQLKEEIVFDKESSRMMTRILGIAPMGPTVVDGKVVAVDSASAQGDGYPLFWIYYPDARAWLSKFEVYNPKNFGNKMSWEDLFESRMFSSYIVKSTLDNPFNRSLLEKTGNSKLFRLLEGENIKEKIFNYEQDLWAY
jgi:gliding motility associated protien GldN